MDYTVHMARLIRRIGRPVQYTPAGGGSVTITADFSTQPKEFIDVEGYVPVLNCITSDVPSAAHGDAFLIDSDSYLVIAKDVDKVSGVTALRLEKQ